MDIKELKELNSWHFDREQQLVNLKNRLSEELAFTFNNGLFTADQNLISFVNSAKIRQLDEFYILDNLDQPIHVTNIEEFMNLAWEHNQRALNEYYLAVTRLNKIRRRPIL